jgi:hypothetical protein
MKNIYILFVAIFFIASIFCSCNKEEQIPKYELTSKNYENEILFNDTLFIKLHNKLVAEFGSTFPDTLPSEIDSTTYEILFKDLIDIGEDFLETMLEVDLSSFIQNNHITSYDLAALGIHVYVSENYGHLMLSKGDWLDCLSAAVGLTMIQELSTAGLSRAMSTGSAIKIIKAVGKRYLGWVGVALMIHDFVNCIS